METREVGRIVERYLALFPGEIHDLALLRSQLPAGRDITDRDNFAGHVTASGIILSKDHTRVAVIFHKYIHRYLQPGGHFLPGDASPRDAAMRAIREETGLTDITPLDFTGDGLPLDIDTHYMPVPEDANGTEPPHYHHDFRYVFVAHGPDVPPAEGEAARWKWMPIEDFGKLGTLRDITSKIRLFSQEHRPAAFLQSAAAPSRVGAPPVSVFAVTHVLPNRLYFLRALSNIAAIAGIIPKRNSVDADTRQRLNDLYPFLSIGKEDLRSVEAIAAEIGRAEGKVALLDIGGYFAPVINELAAIFGDKLIGVIEDTENGHKKYEALPVLKAPVISVARSPLKDNEDYLVGQSIVSATEAVLNDANRLLNYLHVGVIGHGKIGASIATHLSRSGIPVACYDTDPLRRVAAINRGHRSPEKDALLAQSDLVFCATGNRSLGADDFRKLKNGAFVVSVTSSDDEMDLPEADRAYRRMDVSKHVTKYYDDEHYFYLVHKGNAVNFINKTIAGDFIYLVQAEVLAALQCLRDNAMASGIYEMSDDVRRNIAQKWLQAWN